MWLQGFNCWTQMSRKNITMHMLNMETFTGKSIDSFVFPMLPQKGSTAFIIFMNVL